MRRFGTALGIEGMSLYKYVADRTRFSTASLTRR
jgi:hypothetical protein